MNSARNKHTGSVIAAIFRLRFALLVVGCAWAINVAPAAAAGCGTARAHGGPQGQLVDVQVTIFVGPVSCHTARRVITDSINSTAPFRGHGLAAYRTIDGWRCLRPTFGYAGCLRGQLRISGRYSPAGCAPGYNRGLPKAAGGPKHFDAINLLATAGLTCSQAAGIAHRYDVPYYSHHTPPRSIATSLGTFSCRTLSRTRTSIEGSCSLNMRRVHWYSVRD